MMKRILLITLITIFAGSLMLTGCESTKGAGKRVGDDLKKTGKKVAKGISKATKDFRERNQ